MATIKQLMVYYSKGIYGNSVANDLITWLLNFLKLLTFLVIGTKYCGLSLSVFIVTLNHTIIESKKIISDVKVFLLMCIKTM